MIVELKQNPFSLRINFIIRIRRGFISRKVKKYLHQTWGNMLTKYFYTL